MDKHHALQKLSLALGERTDFRQSMAGLVFYSSPESMLSGLRNLGEAPISGLELQNSALSRLGPASWEANHATGECGL